MKSDLPGRLALTAAVLCATLVAVTVGALMMPAVRVKLGLAPAPTASYAVGARVDVPASAYDGSQYTVILFAQSECSACQKNKPWLANLTAALQQQPSVRVVMVTGADHVSDEIAYASDLGLGREHVVPLVIRALKVRTVPTLVLVDQRGVVRYSQEGIPNGNRDQVIETMKARTQLR